MKRAQEAGDGALEEGLFRRDGVGGVQLHDRVGVDDGLQLRIGIVRARRVAAAQSKAAVSRNINRAKLRIYRFGRRGKGAVSECLRRAWHVGEVGHL